MRQLTNENAEVVLAQTYEPYGEVLSSAGEGESSYAYAGEWTDMAGLQYLRAHYMNPAVGRFITRDIWAGDYNSPLSLNRWGYVQGNPVMYVDPSGNFPLSPPSPHPCMDGNCNQDIIDCGQKYPVSLNRNLLSSNTGITGVSGIIV